jgi:LysM repeat protein
MRGATAATLVSLVLCIPSAGSAQSLRGSPASLTRQNVQAKQHDYTYLERPEDVRRFVELGLLVPVEPSSAFELARVSFPYARPEVKLFLERLGRQYEAACGEKLVVTSLVRPVTRQPRNAADRSVHPTGMAIDLRRSHRASCRRWLERVLLQLEARRVLEATRERRPPHYHVALFPKPYLQYVVALTGSDAASLLAAVNAAPASRTSASARAEARIAAAAGPSGDVTAENAAELEDTADGAASEGTDGSGDVVLYRVQRGDSLWSIARRFGTTVARLKEENGLTSSRLMPQQVLRIPIEG